MPSTTGRRRPGNCFNKPGFQDIVPYHRVGYSRTVMGRRVSGNGMREEDTPNPQTAHYSTIRWSLWALLAYCMIAVSLTGPALLGQGSIIPEGYLDRDILYKELTEAKLRPFQDATPIVLELGRARAVASGLSHRRIDTWNPWSGAG